MHDTPLGYVIAIRSEKDRKKISGMTNAEMEIRKKWQQFKATQKAKMPEKVQYTMTVEQFQAVLKNLAGG